VAILEKRHVTLFHWVDVGSDIPPVSITKNERFLSCDSVLIVVRYGDVRRGVREKEEYGRKLTSKCEVKCSVVR
jgi:hypothetical protein